MPVDYSLLDATLEILLMLLTAFVLGWLFCWLMKKLFGRNKTDGIEDTHTASSADLESQPARTGLSTSSRERLYDPDVGIPKTELDADIEIPTVKTPTLDSVGINTSDVEPPKTEIKSPRPRIDIPDLKAPDINLPDLDIKGKVGTGLGAAAAGIGAVGIGAMSLKDKAVDAADEVDLSLNKPNIDLPDTGVNLSDTESIDLPEIDAPEVDLPELKTDTDLPDVDLPDIDTPNLKADIDLNTEITLPDTPDLKVDTDLPDIDTPDLQADIDLPDASIDLPDVEVPELTADIGLPEVDTELPSTELKLDELDLPEAATDLDTSEIDLPDPSTPNIPETIEATVDSGKGLLGKGLGAAAAGLGAVTAGATSLKSKAADKVDEIGDDLTHPDLPIKRDHSETVGDGRVDTQLAEADDLTRITGIDNSMATLLNSKGIDSFDKLRDTDRNTLKSYIQELDSDSQTDIEPASWPHQAKLCADKNWRKLDEYQSFLSGGSEDVTEKHSTATFDDAIKDDLKKIEGIGPYFESLLNNAGITTYEQLKNSDRDTLKEIIDAAGPDYRMHEPETWPYQAGLAAQGDWKKLQDYINFMTGRN